MLLVLLSLLRVPALADVAGVAGVTAGVAGVDTRVAAGVTAGIVVDVASVAAVVAASVAVSAAAAAAIVVAVVVVALSLSLSLLLLLPCVAIRAAASICRCSCRCFLYFRCRCYRCYCCRCDRFLVVFFVAVGKNSISLCEKFVRKREDQNPKIIPQEADLKKLLVRRASGKFDVAREVRKKNRGVEAYERGQSRRQGELNTGYHTSACDSPSVSGYRGFFPLNRAGSPIFGVCTIWIGIITCAWERLRRFY